MNKVARVDVALGVWIGATAAVLWLMQYLPAGILRALILLLPLVAALYVCVVGLRQMLAVIHGRFLRAWAIGSVSAAMLAMGALYALIALLQLPR